MEERNLEGWRQRKRKARCLIISILLTALIGLLLIAAIGVLKAYYKIKIQEEICTTSGCVQTAANVLKWIDPQVDPCEDFYEFACGNFIRNTGIPDDASSVSTSGDANSLVQEQLRLLLEEPIRENESRPFVLIKRLYKACMDTSLIEQIGLDEAKALLDDFGGWPVLKGDDWDGKEFDWQSTIRKLAKNGFPSDNVIQIAVEIDEKNSSRRIINIGQPFLVISADYLTEGFADGIFQAYRSYMVDVAVIFGAERNKAQKEMWEALNFEVKLANISDSMEEMRDVEALYNPMTIKQLQDLHTKINWSELIDEYLAPEAVTEDEIVNVNSPRFLKQLEEIIADMHNRTIANYLMWKAVSYTISYLTENLRNRQHEFITFLAGEMETTARWSECVNVCATNLKVAADAMYVRRYFKEGAKKAVEELVEDIKEEFKLGLTRVDWMDGETKERALKKASVIAEHVGYPIELLDDGKLEAYYQNLEIDEKAYLQSSLNASLFSTKIAFKKLFLPVNKTDWSTHSDATAVNAYYNTNENSIQLPAGILQGVYFNRDRPSYMNYGGIGFIIGHEITHGFDDEGRKYDAKGNLQNWWAKDTENAFVDNSGCIISQYDNFTIPEIGIKINGVATQGENIADNGGVKHAYLAYDRFIRKNGEEPKLPGLNYTGRQMFWIAAANIWCSKTRPEQLKQRSFDDPHSPDRFRVLGSFSNVMDFAKDFKCAVGSWMNPEEKCEIW